MKKLLLVLAVVVFFGFLSGCERRDTFPSRPVTLIIGFDPGSVSDVSGRIIAQLAEPHLGQTINIVNSPGTSGAVSYQQIFTARNDGYTIVKTTLTLVAHELMGVINFSFRDLTPILTFQTDPIVLFASSRAPFSTWEEMIEYSKANPGRVNVGVSSVGGLSNIAAQLMARELGVDWNLVVGTGGGIAGVTQAAGGHIELAVGGALEGLPFIDSGDLKAFAVTSHYRLESFPDLPTCIELGLDLTIGNVRALFGPPNMNPEHVAILRAAFDKAVAEPRFAEYLESSGAALLHLDSADTMRAFDELSRELAPILRR